MTYEVELKTLKNFISFHTQAPMISFTLLASLLQKYHLQKYLVHCGEVKILVGNIDAECRTALISVHSNQWMRRKTWTIDQWDHLSTIHTSAWPGYNFFAIPTYQVLWNYFWLYYISMYVSHICIFFVKHIFKLFFINTSLYCTMYRLYICRECRLYNTGMNHCKN